MLLWWIRNWRYWIPFVAVLVLGLVPYFRDGMVAVFGVGLPIVILAFLMFLFMLWWRRFNLLWRHWRWWLAGIVIAIWLFGFLALFSAHQGILHDKTLGGKWGQSIIGGRDIDVWAILTLSVIFLVALLIIIPDHTLSAFRKFFWEVLGTKEIYYKYVVPSRLGRWLHLTKKKKARAAKEEAEPEADAEEDVVDAKARKLSRQLGKRYAEAAPIRTAGGWLLPPVDILDLTREAEVAQVDNEQRARLLEEALASYGVEAKVVQINPGPAVTQFGVEPGWDHKYKEIKEKNAKGATVVRREEISRTRVKVDRIASLANDLALAMAAPTVRIEAPVPGKSMVGVEVPNVSWGAVTLRAVIEGPAFQRLKSKSGLSLALGKGAGGEAVSADLAKMPHLLIAGTTGSGKTVCLNAVISCVLMHNTPDDVRFVMIDPKRVEMIQFNSIPHLLFPVVVETTRAVELLRWLGGEMERRYKVFATVGARNIETFNLKRPAEKMPYIVLVVDELADLMMSAFEEVESGIIHLAHQSRATGIHLVIATQRPSVDVVTGLIKANLPTRISFAVSSQVDSRTILDTVGAEKLLGKGDMLFLPTDAAKPKRLQGCLVSDEEIERLVNFWAGQRPKQPAAPPPEQAPAEKAPETLIDQARQLAKKHTSVSASFLQRRLGIGLAKAHELMEQLEKEGLLKGTGEQVEEGGEEEKEK